jgi:hypothetical protein
MLPDAWRRTPNARFLGARKAVLLLGVVVGIGIAIFTLPQAPEPGLVPRSQLGNGRDPQPGLCRTFPDRGYGRFSDNLQSFQVGRKEGPGQETIMNRQCSRCGRQVGGTAGFSPCWRAETRQTFHSGNPQRPELPLVDCQKATEP